MSANHKPLPELDVDPADIPRLMRAAQQLPGVTPTVARNLGGWLIAVHAGLDQATSSTKWRYRRILHQLAEQAPPPKGRSHQETLNLPAAA